MLAGFSGMMRGMGLMPVSGMRVVSGRFVVPFFMLLSRGAMMLGCVFVMFRRLAMMIDGFFRHGISSAVSYPRIVTSGSRPHEVRVLCDDVLLAGRLPKRLVASGGPEA